ncbi:MAG: hypothetical protein M3O91_07275 [Chloroflexota bacterium]|nr:hypothetical protein [Chloroflexota bacterium]
MDAAGLRAAFRLAFLITAMALVTLPFQPGGSREFFVTVLAAAVGLLFLGLVLLLLRFSATCLPPPRVTSPRERD